MAPNSAVGITMLANVDSGESQRITMIALPVNAASAARRPLDVPANTATVSRYDGPPWPGESWREAAFDATGALCVSAAPLRAGAHAGAR